MKAIDIIRTYIGQKPTDGAVCIGRAEKFLRPAEWITEKQINHHIHIVGASGFGKTVLISLPTLILKLPVSTAPFKTSFSSPKVSKIVMKRLALFLAR